MTGGATTPSGYGGADRPAPVRPVRESPATDGVGQGFVLSTSTAPIVHLSGARARLLAISAAERRHVVLLTQGSARLTPAMHEALVAFGGIWVANTPAGLRDVATGRRLARIEDAINVPASTDDEGLDGSGDGDGDGDGDAQDSPALAPEHGDIAVAQNELRQILIITATVRHRNTTTAPYGAALRHIAEAMLGPTAFDWGVREPMVTPWEADEVAEFIRPRTERPPSVIVTGGGEDGRIALGSVRVSPRTRGAVETYTLRVDLGPARDPSVTDRWLALTEVLTELPEIGMPLYVSATAEIGLADLSIWPWLRPPAVPVSLLIGAAGVARFSLARRKGILEDHFGVEFVGGERRPSLVAELGEGPRAENADELAALLGAIGANAVETGLGPILPASMFGETWRDVITNAAHEKLGDELMAELARIDDPPSAEAGADDDMDTDDMAADMDAEADINTDAEADAEQDPSNEGRSDDAV